MSTTQEDFTKITDEQHYDRHLRGLIDMLETKKEVPWHKPWRMGAGAVANLASGRRYTGLSNIMLLSFAGWDSQWWVTENKITEFCGHIKEGEEDRFQYVFYWHAHKYNHTDTQTGEVRMGTSFYPRTHKVWNTDQTEGLVHHRLVQPEPFEHVVIPEVKDLIENYCSGKGPGLTYGGSRATYFPKKDEVKVPNMEEFERYAEFCSTTFHELGHSTGHKTRLNRKGVDKLDSSDVDLYGKEELIAEMASSYLMSFFKFDEQEIEDATDNSIEYIRAWSKRIKDDPKMFVVAGRQAEKAALAIIEASA